jgi:hypothetical protein
MPSGVQKVSKVALTLEDGTTIVYKGRGTLMNTNTYKEVESWAPDAPEDQKHPDLTKVDVNFITVTFLPDA